MQYEERWRITIGVWEWNASTKRKWIECNDIFDMNTLHVSVCECVYRPAKHIRWWFKVLVLINLCTHPPSLTKANQPSRSTPYFIAIVSIYYILSIKLRAIDFIWISQSYIDLIDGNRHFHWPLIGFIKNNSIQHTLISSYIYK